MTCAVSISALSLIGTGCVAGQTLTFRDVPETVGGNIVSLSAVASGVDIVPPDGDTSGESGHFHVFVDRDPVANGEVIPWVRGVVHSATSPIFIYGLEPGEHEFTVTIGDGTHKRLHDDLQDTVRVDVRGPSVVGAARATIEAGDALEIELEAIGVDIVEADGTRSQKNGHYHILVDPKVVPEAGNAIGTSVENRIIHTADPKVTVEALEKGEHTIWVVLGDGQHYAFDPPVMDRLTVTVE